MAAPNLRPANDTDTTAYSGKTGSYVDNTQVLSRSSTKKTLRNFYITTFYQDIFNTDYQGEIKGQGSKVWIRKTPEITVRGYAVGTKLTYEVPTKDAGELVIDQGLYTAFQVDDVNAAQSDMGLVSMFAEDAAQRIKIAVDAEVLQYIATRPATANKGGTAGAISGNINLGAITGAGASVSITSDTAIDKIVDLNQVLDESNIPSENRWIIIPAWFAALLKKGDLKSAEVTGDSTGEAII